MLQAVETLDQVIHDWRDFYVLIGTTAGTLVGLQFISASLAATILPGQDEKSIAAFVTPTIVHFTSVLVTAAFMVFPAQGATLLGFLLAILSFTGLAIVLQPARNLWKWRRQQKLTLSRLTWYTLLPMASYVTIGATAVALLAGAIPPFWPQGLAIMLLLIVGIRNAWDLFVWIYNNRKA